MKNTRGIFRTILIAMIGICVMTVFMSCESKPSMPVFPTEISIGTPVNGSVEMGTPYKLKIVPVPANATELKMEWTSSDTRVATVGSKGTVTGYTPGQVTIKAKSLAVPELEAEITLKIILPAPDESALKFLPFIFEKHVYDEDPLIRDNIEIFTNTAYGRFSESRLRSEMDRRIGEFDVVSYEISRDEQDTLRISYVQTAELGTVEATCTNTVQGGWNIIRIYKNAEGLETGRDNIDYQLTTKGTKVRSYSKNSTSADIVESYVNPNYLEPGDEWYLHDATSFSSRNRLTYYYTGRDITRLPEDTAVMRKDMYEGNLNIPLATALYRYHGIRAKRLSFIYSKDMLPGRTEAYIHYDGNGEYVLSEDMKASLPIFLVDTLSFQKMNDHRFTPEHESGLKAWMARGEDGQMEALEFCGIPTTLSARAFESAPASPGWQRLPDGSMHSDDGNVSVRIDKTDNTVSICLKGTVMDSILSEYFPGTVTRSL